MNYRLLRFGKSRYQIGLSGWYTSIAITDDEYRVLEYFYDNGNIYHMSFGKIFEENNLCRKSFTSLFEKGVISYFASSGRYKVSTDCFISIIKGQLFLSFYGEKNKEKEVVESKHIELNDLTLDEYYVLSILNRFSRLSSLELQNLTSVTAISELIGKGVIYNKAVLNSTNTSFAGEFYAIRPEYMYLVEEFNKLFNVKEV